MKNLFRITTASIFILALAFQAGASDDYNRKAKAPQGYVTIKGKVIDAETKNALVFATVAVQNSNVATITNLDGEFMLKLANSLKNPVLEISFIGFKNFIIAVDDLNTGDKKNNIELSPSSFPIAEIVIKPISPQEIIHNMMKNFNDNYTDIPNQMTSFYRETIKRNRSYVSIAEAVVEIFKAPYNNEFKFDLAKVYKGRKNVEVSRLDTVLFKLQGGPVTTLQLDIVKNKISLLTQEAMESYDFTLENIVSINDKPHYEIGFKQKNNVHIAMFLGRLFIEIESFALTEAEFGVNLDDKESAAEIFIRKKPLGMKVTPEMVAYKVKFREQNGKWYFAYARAEVKFKVNWKKKLFNTNYTTMSEIAVTDRTEQDVVRFPSKERIKKGDIFTEELSAFSDDNFWGDYNVIEPDQSIESAIRKLNRKLKFSDRAKK